MNVHENRELALWQQAQTFQDLCELTAQWLESRISYHPCYGGSIDPETEPIAPILSICNRSGLLTLFSQPAVPIDKTGSGQRACLEGLVQDGLAQRIAALGLFTDLLVMAFKPGEEGGYLIPITTDNFHPFTWCGACWGDTDLECFGEICNKKAIEALRLAWRVCIIDPKWGREEYLWKNVTRILTIPEMRLKPYSITPSPELGLDTDFVH